MNVYPETTEGSTVNLYTYTFRPSVSVPTSEMSPAARHDFEVAVIASLPDLVREKNGAIIKAASKWDEGVLAVSVLMAMRPLSGPDAIGRLFG